MVAKDFTFYSVKIISDLIRDIIYFPAWWYSQGLLQFVLILKNFLVSKQKSLALLVWIKNIFRPMYGQYDWQGMLISFFMRVFQIIVRSLMMLFGAMVCLLALIGWVILPLLVIYEIIFQIAL